MFITAKVILKHCEDEGLLDCFTSFAMTDRDALPSLRGHAVAAVIQALPLIALWGVTKFFIHEERDQKKEMATSAFYPILP